MTLKTYKISASLINSLKYHKLTNSQESYKQLVNALNNKFESNPFLQEGNTFEDAVFNDRLSQRELYLITKDCIKQKWYNSFIEVRGYNFRVSGKLDAITKDESIIYDIKHTRNFSKEKYDDISTIQHDLYYFLVPKAKEFYYLIGTPNKDFETSKTYTYRAISKTRKENNIEYIKKSIEEFLDFLDMNDLLKLYLKNFGCTK